MIRYPDKDGRPLVLIISKMSGYVKTFKFKDGDKDNWTKLKIKIEIKIR